MKTITFSFSELDTFRQCPFKHELGYKQRWVTPTPGPALVRGTNWHTIMETHYRKLKAAAEGETPLLPLDGHYDWLIDECGVAGMPERELLEWMLEGYLDLYGFDMQWKVLAVEHAPELWLPTPRGGRSRFKLKLKVDLIVKDQLGIWVVDHKSGRNLPSDKELDIDDQFGLYTWALRRMGKKVIGSIHSAARTQQNKDQEKHPQSLESRFKRTRLNRTDEELDQLAIDAYLAISRAYRIKEGEADRAPNTDTCRWKCDFTEPCLGSRKGGNVVNLLEDFGFSQNFERH